MFSIVASGLTPGVDWAGHLGGGIAGLFYGLAFFPRVRSSRIPMVGYIGLALFVSFFTLCSGLFWGR